MLMPVTIALLRQMTTVLVHMLTHAMTATVHVFPTQTMMESATNLRLPVARMKQLVTTALLRQTTTVLVHMLTQAMTATEFA